MKNIYQHIIAEQKMALASTKDLLNQAINIISGLENEVNELENRLRKNGGQECNNEKEE